MIILIAPAKTLDMNKSLGEKHSLPVFWNHSWELLQELKQLKEEEIKDLMHISPKLAELNYQRFQNFNKNFMQENSTQALIAFQGDVYKGIDVENYNKKELDFAQKHLRMLSGLYGLLRPLDLMQAYRLEMGTKYNNARGKNLYEFWGDLITNQINKEMDKHNEKLIINLASNEYFNSINKKLINYPILNIHFKENRDGKYKIIAFNAKRARGEMANYIIKQSILAPKEIKKFSLSNYKYNDQLSDKDNMVFTR